MKKTWLGALAIIPAVAFAGMALAQTAGAPTVSPPSPAGATAPSGTDTPVTLVPGIRSDPATTPTVDSSGVNQSGDGSATGAVMPPVGAPRLPGVPRNPPTGPSAPP